MLGKSAKALALESLNALIAGGHFSEKLIRSTAKGPRVDTEAMKVVEDQLTEYYARRVPGA